MATWKEIKGTVEEKIKAILESSAFIIRWGFRPPVQYDVKVKGDYISWTDTNEGDKSKWKIETLRKRLTKLDNPRVEVSCDYGR